MWSVTFDRDGQRKVYDVYCQNASGGAVTQYKVWLKPTFDGSEMYFLGYALKSTAGLGTNWWAFDGGNKVKTVKGFATRRHAIEYMLYEHGVWKDDPY